VGGGHSWNTSYPFRIVENEGKSRKKGFLFTLLLKRKANVSKKVNLLEPFSRNKSEGLKCDL